MLAGVTDGTDLHFGAAGRDADDHTQRGGEPPTAAADHTDHATDHMLGSVEVSDDPFAQGANRADVSIALLVHLAGFGAHGDHLAGAVVEGCY